MAAAFDPAVELAALKAEYAMIQAQLNALCNDDSTYTAVSNGPVGHDLQQRLIKNQEAQTAVINMIREEPAWIRRLPDPSPAAGQPLASDPPRSAVMRAGAAAPVTTHQAKAPVALSDAHCRPSEEVVSVTMQSLSDAADDPDLRPTTGFHSTATPVTHTAERDGVDSTDDADAGHADLGDCDVGISDLDLGGDWASCGSSNADAAGFKFLQTNFQVFDAALAYNRHIRGAIDAFYEDFKSTVERTAADREYETHMEAAWQRRNLTYPIHGALQTVSAVVVVVNLVFPAWVGFLETCVQEHIVSRHFAAVGTDSTKAVKRVRRSGQVTHD
jgi:hypothetical protein